ncbi:hypothetical protein PPL_02600 [Heterostelium album PN500]|uniref:Ankyrin repeat-containing protein n=1 Tax=Heterostelium pallidum (strain ATCC 26659 / Pp 5 / PN500) TaxID=670386 RepID=D3B2I7_HETP5|nr:hypothetical protein PPL_02600 [Heterostelium album PN500]EFA83535.1 hypothetical protein PPL_02600 [Heterostelium album PN500]|eukprot:XP_020435652.1 hypothetical protein PPL_02600 [Heterostelium album PN500]
MEQYSIDKSLRNCFKYHHWLDVSNMILENPHSNTYPYLLLDKLKHPIYRDSIRFTNYDARVLCRSVRDYQLFHSIYRLKQRYFIGAGVVESACSGGNLEIVKLLVNQVDPVALPLDGAMDSAIDKGHTDIVLYLHRHVISKSLPVEQQCNYKRIIKKTEYHRNYIANWFRLWQNDKSDGHSAMLELFGGKDEIDCIKRMIDQLKPSVYHILSLGLTIFYQLADSYNYRYKAPFDNLDQLNMSNLFKHQSFLQQSFEEKAEIVAIILMLQRKKVPESSTEVNFEISEILKSTTDSHLDPHKTSDNWELIYLFLQSLIQNSNDLDYLDRMIELEMSLPNIGYPQLAKIMKQAGNSKYLVYGYANLEQLRIILDQLNDNPFDDFYEFSHSIMFNLISKKNPNIIVADFLLDRFLTIHPSRIGMVFNLLVDIKVESREAIKFVFMRRNDFNQELSISVDTIMNIFNHRGLYEELLELSKSTIPETEWFIMFEKVAFSTTVPYDWRYHHIMSLIAPVFADSVIRRQNYRYTNIRINHGTPFTSNNFRYLKSIANPTMRDSPIRIEIAHIEMGAYGTPEIYRLLIQLQKDKLIEIINGAWEFLALHHAHAHRNYKLIESIKSTSDLSLYDKWIGDNMSHSRHRTYASTAKVLTVPSVQHYLEFIQSPQNQQRSEPIQLSDLLLKLIKELCTIEQLDYLYNVDDGKWRNEIQIAFSKTDILQHCSYRNEIILWLINNNIQAKVDNTNNKFECDNYILNLSKQNNILIFGNEIKNNNNNNNSIKNNNTTNYIILLYSNQNEGRD